MQINTWHVAYAYTDTDHEGEFDSKVFRALKDIQEDGSEVIDIKYGAVPITDETGMSIGSEYSALIIYKS